MKKLIAIALAFTLPAAMAQAATYECKTTNFGRDGWVSNAFLVSYDEKRGSGVMYDAFIHEVHKKPIAADWERRNASSSTFRWKVKGPKASNSGGQILTYKFTLFEDRKRFSLNGRLHGADNVISGSGTCKRTK